VTSITRKVSPDEPEGGWLGPRGPGGWPDLEELDRRQREQYALEQSRRKR
jgi:hypothetical protein